MVKYYLSVKRKKNISVIEKINDELNGSLREIDEFTSLYNNEEELKEEMGKIYGIKIDGEIIISYKIKKDGVEKNFELTPFYKNGYKYMLNESGIVSPEKIRGYIFEKTNDFIFLEKLAGFYYIPNKNCPQKFNYFSIVDYINLSKSYECNYEISSEFFEAMDDLIRREVIKDNGEINYFGLRRLVMFVIKYNEKLKLNEFRNQIEIIKEEYDPERFRNYADNDKYPGDLELGSRKEGSGYIMEDEIENEEFAKKR